MFLTLMFWTIIFTIIAIVIAFFFPPKAKKVAALFLLCSVTVFMLYFFHMPFKYTVDIAINSTSSHLYNNASDTSTGGSMPLPPRTAFSYKWSLSAMEYATRTNEERIVELFSDLSDSDEDVDILHQENKTILSFYYNQEYFVVEINQISKRIWVFKIDNSLEKRFLDSY
jgi:c-di-AMP phosphodiesterase-like protein